MRGRAVITALTVAGCQSLSYATGGDEYKKMEAPELLHDIQQNCQVDSMRQDEVTRDLCIRKMGFLFGRPEGSEYKKKYFHDASVDGMGQHVMEHMHADDEVLAYSKHMLTTEQAAALQQEGPQAAHSLLRREQQPAAAAMLLPVPRPLHETLNTDPGVAPEASFAPTLVASDTPVRDPALPHPTLGSEHLSAVSSVGSQTEASDASAETPSDGEFQGGEVTAEEQQQLRVPVPKAGSASAVTKRRQPALGPDAQLLPVPAPLLPEVDQENVKARLSNVDEPDHLIDAAVATPESVQAQGALDSALALRAEGTAESSVSKMSGQSSVMSAEKAEATQPSEHAAAAVRLFFPIPAPATAPSHTLTPALTAEGVGEMVTVEGSDVEEVHAPLPADDVAAAASLLFPVPAQRVHVHAGAEKAEATHPSEHAAAAVRLFFPIPAPATAPSHILTRTVTAEAPAVAAGGSEVDEALSDSVPASQSALRDQSVKAPLFPVPAAFRHTAASSVFRHTHPSIRSEVSSDPDVSLQTTARSNSES